jgi:carbonic anhydrase
VTSRGAAAACTSEPAGPVDVRLAPRSGSRLETAQLGADGFTDVGEGPGSEAAYDIDFLTISDQSGAVTEDVERIRNHPLVPARIPIHGYLYDVKSGQLLEVPEATKAGAAS